MHEPQAGALAAVAALDEPTRRRLYSYVVRQPVPVSRDDAAAALSLPRATVAFHLDRLVDEQLLAVGHERRTGRSGPGAGRPAKLYRRSDRQVSVSLPERQYELAGQLLATAVEEADETGDPAREILTRRARERGADLAAGAPDILGTLEEHGFEPRVDGDQVLLGNCPFHQLARTHQRLVCEMNLGLVEGMLDGVGERGLRARLEPGPGLCCVRLGPA
ncbi:helix-turn-helix domain-containing protein [Amycolatopsis sp. SID8362]|uniref:helix-turn-helix transcriptional regulator n=1 Tax=Amycolatopsis sp. SID8362 TaxID=2690346 RepID=UPI00136E1DB5|nr:helix-turn-helix domain-containing protein [Amycolatopsis sp. SID8362]NBH07605.1 helix-turn-helix domain-containing protein [Amycolatopsis sp. SID8362]NED44301.1 helix-turn-helix domain-containing protein [Amycolatopsis sp. SID8362]